MPPRPPPRRACALQGTEPGELLSEQAAFSYTVTHDLRAPIRVVEGFARILKEDYGRVLDRIGNDHLDRVLAAAARMNSMIDALLTLANLSAQPLARQPVNLSQLAGFVVDDLKRAAAERHVEVDIAPGMVADGDPTLLRLVLENLLGNAWKYSARNAAGQAAVPLRTRRARARSSASATTAPASTCATPTACSACSSACTAPTTSRAPASAWRRSSASCAAMAATSGPNPNPAAARAFTSR